MEDEARVRGWIAQTVLNESASVRRRRRTEARAPAWRWLGWFRPASNDEQVPAAQVAAERKELRTAVLDALEQLPEVTRLVVVLRDMQGYPGVQVAELLGCRDTEVSQHLHNGRRQLRKLLASWCDVNHPDA